MASDDVLDRETVAGLFRAQDAFANPEFIRQLVGLFRGKAPGRLDRIRQSVADADVEAIREVAHALRTNCGMLGATRMADACARMEEGAARGHLPAIATALEDAQRELPRVLEALSALIEQRGQPPGRSAGPSSMP